jgi:hypothetical protein
LKKKKYIDITSSLNVSLKKKYKNMKFLKVYDNIHDSTNIDKIKLELRNLKGIYGFLCKNNNKIYIGSSENLVNRFLEHIQGRKSNLKLQRSISKYGLENFYYIIFEIFNSNQNNSLIKSETLFLSYFKLSHLFNFKIIASSFTPSAIAEGVNHDFSPF